MSCKFVFNIKDVVFICLKYLSPKEFSQFWKTSRNCRRFAQIQFSLNKLFYITDNFKIGTIPQTYFKETTFKYLFVKHFASCFNPFLKNNSNLSIRICWNDVEWNIDCEENTTQLTFYANSWQLFKSLPKIATILQKSASELMADNDIYLFEGKGIDHHINEIQKIIHLVLSDKDDTKITSHYIDVDIIGPNLPTQIEFVLFEEKRYLQIPKTDFKGNKENCYFGLCCQEIYLQLEDEICDIQEIERQRLEVNLKLNLKRKKKKKRKEGILLP